MNHRLRFITCGSVDDGKSSLIGRLLFDTKQIFDDQYQAIQKDSVRFGTQGAVPDLALLVDGLQAEREQGITIDVAYRFFSTPQRAFIVADTPGHEQYTRNMATGASTADAAVVLVDARKGVLTQTRRHSRILAMMGVRQVLLAVNKMDMVDWHKPTYDAICADYTTFASALGLGSVQAIPMSALTGDNISGSNTSPNTPWYSGPTLLQWLEAVPNAQPTASAPLRMAVQMVLRPNAEFRGYAGRIAQGTVRAGDPVVVLPSSARSTVKQVFIGEHPVEQARTGDSVCITLTDERDISRGDVVCAAQTPLDMAEQFHAQVVWMHDSPLVPGRPYMLKLHHQTVQATVSSIRHRIDPSTGVHLAARELVLNDIAAVHLSLSKPLAFATYADNRDLGGFILIDRITNATVGAGTLDYALRRDHNLHWQDLTVNKTSRAALMHQTPRCIWFTGLSGSGKSTLANLLDKRLHAQGHYTYVLDGDNVRHGLNRDLGFTEADRAENVRRVAEVARLMVDAGLMVIVAFISPFRADRDFARSLFAPEEFVEVFVDTPLAECERRDVKGLYALARAGKIPNFSGISSPYEPPDAPELRIDSSVETEDAASQRIFQKVISWA
jgi:bifunctional enzyme CysN/CysC